MQGEPLRPPNRIGLRNEALRITARVLGIWAGLLGFEHGWFETQQGNVPTNGLIISAIGPPCQPATAWHACEPAFTLFSGFLVSGVLTMAIASVVVVWAVTFRRRIHGATLLALVVALFLVGGGFVTLLLGLVGVTAATQVGAPLDWWRAHLRGGLAARLAGLWPWLLIAYLAWSVGSWLIADRFADLMLRLTPVLSAMTPLALVMTVVSAIAHDLRATGNASQTADETPS
jgi:hypothetical protein